MNNNFFSNMKTKLDAIALVHENDAPSAETETDAVDTVTLDVPLLIRMLEYAREDAKTDMDLHNVTERMISLAKSGTLSMEHYNDIVKQAGEHAMEAKDRSPGKIDKNEDPCWSGYHMVGTKKKGGREVPDCVPGKKG